MRIAALAASLTLLTHAGNNPVAEFMRSLKTYDGRSCCSMTLNGGDCVELGETNYWPNPAEPGGYIANHHGLLIRVPPAAVQSRPDNPFDSAVICVYYDWHGAEVRCFVLPTLTQ